MLDTLISVDIQEIVKVGGKIFEICDGIIITEKFKKLPSQNFLEKFVELRLKCKKVGNDVKQPLLENTGNGVYGQTTGKDLDFVHKCETKDWMGRDCLIEIVQYWQIPVYYYIANFIRDSGTDDDGMIDDKNTMLLRFAVFILSKSMRIMIKFVVSIGGPKDDKVCYTETVTQTLSHFT